MLLGHLDIALDVQVLQPFQGGVLLGHGHIANDVQLLAVAPHGGRIQGDIIQHHGGVVRDQDELGLLVNQVHQLLRLGLGHNHLFGAEGGALAAQDSAIQLGVHHNHPPGRPVQAVLGPEGEHLVDDGVALEDDGPVGVAGGSAVDIDVGQGGIHALRAGEGAVDRDAHAVFQLLLGVGVDGEHPIDHQVKGSGGDGVTVVNLVLAIDGPQMHVSSHLQHVGTVQGNGQLAHHRFSLGAGEQGGAVDDNGLVVGVVLLLHGSGVTGGAVDNQVLSHIPFLLYGCSCCFRYFRHRDSLDRTVPGGMFNIWEISWAV